MANINSITKEDTTKSFTWGTESEIESATVILLYILPVNSFEFLRCTTARSAVYISSFGRVPIYKVAEMEDLYDQFELLAFFRFDCVFCPIRSVFASFFRGSLVM